MGKGRSLELFFIDGKPDGMLTAEVFNWTGHVLKIPRTRIKEALGRGEAGYTGVYILLGQVDDEPLAYIGEAEDLGKRLRDHVKAKDWWDTAILVTSTANNLHKAHVKYLESRLVEIALAAKHVPLENGNQPPRSSLSESGTANMEEFLDTLMMVLPAIQVNMFVNKAIETQSVSRSDVSTDGVLFQIISKKLKIDATAKLLNGEMVVLQGSIIRDEWVGKGNWDSASQKIRKTLLETGGIVKNGSETKFTIDYSFSSPSSAACVVTGRPSNGRVEWKLKGTNTTYAEWEADQLKQLDSQT